MAPDMTNTRTPTILVISELNSMAFGLAVYASQCRLPRPHARLASSRWSDATGWAFHPQGSSERFQNCFLTCLSSFPKLCLAQCHDGGFLKHVNKGMSKRDHRLPHPVNSIG